MFFNVFSIIVTKTKVNAKYKTKNNMTDEIPVFLAIKNQMTANKSSIKNLRLKETRVCIVWLPASLFCPLKKMIREINPINVKEPERIATSLTGRSDS